MRCVSSLPRGGVGSDAAAEKPAQPSAAADRDDESSGGIPEIPDLDDLDAGAADGDITQTVADAPKVRNNRILTLRELEGDGPLSLGADGLSGARKKKKKEEKIVELCK
jgi:hypothetical protein